MRSQYLHGIIKRFWEIIVGSRLLLKFVQELRDTMVCLTVFGDKVVAIRENFLHYGVDYEFLADVVAG